ncbi:MAG TPA: hypothetical protein VHW64_16840 [Nocardioides sp.]|uniref:hypothetical protein n=1 Tax=Nocardioides sp. TaxID=35761 RepID=UPI002E332D8B|nr:hypothetical protein [Nocardioides sp.]HEX3932366.1 hypothetical protein [Nocardioides sp.]
MAQRVVVHIGLMKSGTTFIQGRLGANRARLLEAGVLFPGPGWQRHVNAVEDLMGHAARTPGSWDSLVEEINAHPGTAVISMEYLAMVSRRAIGIVAESFGAAELRVVLGARDLGRNVPAMWQEAVKNRSTRTFGEYVEGIHGRSESGRRFWRQQRAGLIAKRWTAQVGADHVYVVTVPPPQAAGDLLWSRFCQAAGISPEPAREEAPRTNESLGAASTSVLRRLNLMTEDLSVQDYKRRVKAVGKYLMPAHRATEDPIGFVAPDWLREESAGMCAVLRTIGVRVVGDLAELTPLDVAGVDPDRIDPAVELDAALAALEATLRHTSKVRAEPQ